jgi:hypothetical protein
MAQPTRLDVMTGSLQFLRGLTAALAIATAATAPLQSAKMLTFTASAVILSMAAIAYGEWAARSLPSQDRK